MAHMCVTRFRGATLLLQQRFERANDGFPTGLSPHEVHLFHLQPIALLPPVASVHQSAERQAIVPLTHKELVHTFLLWFDGLGARDNSTH